MAVSKVHLLVSNSRTNMLAKHHPTTSRNIMKKGHTVDMLITILPKFENLLNINQSCIAFHTFKDFQGVTGLGLTGGIIWEVGLK